MRLRPAKALLALAVGGLAACTCSREPEPAVPSAAVLVTVDTWRADHFDAHHTPHLWELAQAGWRFEDAWTPVGLTSPAHATLFTGEFPWHHGMRANNHHGSRLPPDATTVAERLRGAGWSTAAFVSAYPAGPEGGLDQGFEVFSGPSAGERPGSETVAEARAWLALQEERAPFFLWVHLFEPHGPYRPPPRDLRAVGGDEADEAGESARYAGEVHAADRYLAPLLEDLADRPVLWVVAGDHGEVLEEEPCSYQHERSIHPAVLRVPLFLAGPGIPRERTASRVGLVDVAPTLLHLLDQPALDEVDGMRLEPGTSGRTTWPAESGLCEPDCAPGCAPEGLLGRDRVVVGPGWRVIQRPGRGRWVEGQGAPPLEERRAMVEAIEPMKAPPGPPALQEARELGYVDGGGD